MNIKNVLIASCLVLLVFTIGPFLYRQNTVQPNSAVATPSSQKKLARVNAVKSNAKTSGRTDSKTPDAFYQVIIDNNIFRPLGWRLPPKPQQYTLVGTTSAPDGSNSEAFILKRGSNQLHTVKVGETLGNVTVKEIQAKQVKLQEDGKEIILRCGTLQFLR